MARKLSPKQEKYKNNRIKGMEPLESYRDAYNSKSLNAKAVQANAYKLEQDTRISLAIDEARQKALDDSILTREEALQILTTNARSEEVAERDKHQAIKQVSTMQGWEAPKKVAQTDAEGNSAPLNVNVNSPDVAAALAGLMDKL